jgi:hypothetical protein
MFPGDAIAMCARKAFLFHVQVEHFAILKKKTGLWIRIGSGLNDFVNSESGFGSRGKKNED